MKETVHVHWEEGIKCTSNIFGFSTGQSNRLFIHLNICHNHRLYDLDLWQFLGRKTTLRKYKEYSYSY